MCAKQLLLWNCQGSIKEFFVFSNAFIAKKQTDLKVLNQVLQNFRIMQLQNYVMDVQTKLNHEKKEREVDQAALTTRYLIFFVFFKLLEIHM